VLKQQHQLFVGLLALADALVMVIATLAAWYVRCYLSQQTWMPRPEHLVKESLLLYVVPIGLLSMRWMGLYRARRDRSIADEIAQIFKTCLLALGLILVCAYILESSIFRADRNVQVLGAMVDVGRVQLGALTLLLPALLSVERTVFRTGLRWLRRRGWNQRHVVIIGTGRVAQIVCRTFERNSWTGIKIRAFISHLEESRRDECLGRPVMGGLADLEASLRELRPDAVYVALPRSRAGQIAEVLERLEKFALDVRLVPDLNPRYLPQNMKVSELDGMPILSYRENPTSGFGGVSKRALDIVGAIGALALFSPLMLAAAVLVRLSGPGPVIFKQRRVSVGGQVFDIYKFRTMYYAEEESSAAVRAARPADADDDAPASSTPEGQQVDGWTRRDDPRVTPIGRWLRRTSLDELPQLFNVLLGEMSLVGPRPERPELIERFREDWRGYMLRQHVKAGMTGWAQVNGLRGQSSLRKRLQYDLFYVKNWSLGFDIKILWLTVFRGFVHRNAH